MFNSNAPEKISGRNSKEIFTARRNYKVACTRDCTGWHVSSFSKSARAIDAHSPPQRAHTHLSPIRFPAFVYSNSERRRRRRRRPSGANRRRPEPFTDKICSREYGHTRRRTHYTWLHVSCSWQLFNVFCRHSTVVYQYCSVPSDIIDEACWRCIVRAYIYFKHCYLLLKNPRTIFLMKFIWTIILIATHQNKLYFDIRNENS